MNFSRMDFFQSVLIVMITRYADLISELSSIAWTYVAKDYENIPDEETQLFEDMITWQDVPIVESQRPELLPLDLQAELHLRSDRTAIAYRKWLRELGLTFGTA